MTSFRAFLGLVSMLVAIIGWTWMLILWAE